MKKLHVLLALAVLASIGLPVDAKCHKDDAKADEPTALLAVPTAAVVGAAKRMNESDKMLVSSYIKSQIAAHSLTMREFAALTPEQQRGVLAPGRQYLLNRSDRRAIMPSRISVPESVVSQVALNHTISSDIIDQYAVSIPASIGMTPTGYRRMLIGDSLVLVSADGMIVDVVSDIY